MTQISDTPNRRARHRTPLLTSLDRDWNLLRRRPSSIRRARSWDIVDLVDVRTLVDLSALVDATQAAHGDAADEILGRLVHLAKHDELAGRIVLQRILPGLISQSRKWQERSGDPTDVVLGAAWIAIRRFDPERRPRHVAAALVSDTIWIAFRRAGRRMLDEVLMPTNVLAGHPAPEIELDPIVALAGTIRAASSAGVTADHLELIRELARVGSPGVVATRRCVTPRTVRNHRDAAATCIRTALGPDWGAWADQLTAAA